MQTINILRNSVLSCAIIFGIFNSNIGNTRDYIYLHVNDKVFSHDVDLYYNDVGCISYNAPNRKLYTRNEMSNKLRLIEDDKYECVYLKPSYQNKYENVFKACDDSKDEYYNKEMNCTLDVVYPDPDESDKMKNKFEELCNQRSANGIEEDLITYLEKMVHEIFGNNYTVPRNWRFDIEAQYPEKRQMLYKENDTESKFFTRYFLGTFDDLMKNNNLELVSVIKYEWKGTAIDDTTKGKEKKYSRRIIRYGFDLLPHIRTHLQQVYNN